MAKHKRKVDQKLAQRQKDYDMSMNKRNADPRAFKKPGSRNLKKG